MTIQTLDGTYTLTPDEEWRVRIGLGIAPGNHPCPRPLPSTDGTGTCLACGWQHARRGPNAIERVVS